MKSYEEAIFTMSETGMKAEVLADEIFEYIDEHGEFITVEYVFTAIDESTNKTHLHIVSVFDYAESEWKEFIKQLEREFDIMFKEFVPC